MQHRWHYIYVILYPALGYKFYYGSRITTRHPDADMTYFGSSKTFKRYNDPNHTEYQSCALKVVLWARKLPHCKKNTRLLSALEIQHIRSALENTEHLGPEVCLNRNYGGRFVLTHAERVAAARKSHENGGGFVNMTKRRHMRIATMGGYISLAMGAGVHGISKEKLADAQERGRATIVKKYAKTYTFINPAGESVTFTNLKQFCRDNALNPGHMRSLNSGKLKSHKGWKRAC
jgi:hypothetical protein